MMPLTGHSLVVCARLILLTLPIILASDAFKQQCLTFTPLNYVQGTIKIQEHISANTTLLFPSNEYDSTCGRSTQLVSAEICRLEVSIPTSGRSGIIMELWLPDPTNWNGRFLGTGNGGLDGCIKYEDLAYGVLHGFATAGSNNGHNGRSGIAFYQNPEVVVDYSWRATITTAMSSQALVKAFYDRSAQKSYFLGCSSGGRQGLSAILPHSYRPSFPGSSNPISLSYRHEEPRNGLDYVYEQPKLKDNLYDGLVLGAPAIDFNNLVSWRASFYPITSAMNSTNFITQNQWKGLIHQEVLRQCDAIDGLEDGIIEDPSLCHFDPKKLLCTDDEKAKVDCLTAAQVGIVSRVFSPLLGESGELLFPAMQPGSEVLAAENLYAGKPFSYSEDWFKYVIYGPEWNASTFSVVDAYVANSLNPAEIRTYPSIHSLRPFQHQGGKILLHHGGQDNQITSFASERFFDHLLLALHEHKSKTYVSPRWWPDYSSTMQDAQAELGEFLRLFRIPGMFHCNSGPGAWVLGQGGGAAADGIGFQPEENVLAAIIAWVELGRAPEAVIGTKFVNDSVLLGVQFQRAHVRYMGPGHH